MLSRWKIALAGCCLLLFAGCDRSAAPSADSLPSGEKTAVESSHRAQHTLPGFPAPNAASTSSTPAPSAKNLSDALLLLKGTTDVEARENLAVGMVASLSPEALALWIGELANMPRGEVRDAMFQAALQRLAETSPREAMDIATKLPPDYTFLPGYVAIARAVAAVWAKTDHQAVYDYAMSMPEGELRKRIQSVAVRHWSDKNPEEAFRFLADLGFDEGGVFISTASRHLAAKDMEQAFQMLDSIRDPRVWDTAAGWMFNVFAKQDTKAATEMLLDQTDPDVGVPLGYALGGHYASNSVPDGIAVLNQIGDTRVANHYIHGMIHRLNSGDMTPLVDNLSKIENIEYRRIMTSSVAHDYSKQNPAGATAWVPSIEDEETRANAYQAVGEGYAINDSTAAAQWLTSLPAGKDRRYAIYGYAMQNARKDPQSSASWALQISEPDVRERLLRNVLAQWRASNSEQAYNRAASSGYSALLPAR